MARAAALPKGSVNVSVAGDWSFAQTLRHLVHATDMWLGKAVLERAEPFHPLGLGYTRPQDEEDVPVATVDVPSYGDVLAAWADRVALVRNFLDTTSRRTCSMSLGTNPHAPQASGERPILPARGS